MTNGDEGAKRKASYPAKGRDAAHIKALIPAGTTGTPGWLILKVFVDHLDRAEDARDRDEDHDYGKKHWTPPLRSTGCRNSTRLNSTELFFHTGAQFGNGGLGTAQNLAFVRSIEAISRLLRQVGV